MPVFNLVLMQWEIKGQWHSVIFWLMIVDGEITCNCVLRNVVLKLFAHASFKKVENIAPPLLVKERAIEDAPFIPNHDTVNINNEPV